LTVSLHNPFSLIGSLPMTVLNASACNPKQLSAVVAAGRRVRAATCLILALGVGGCATTKVDFSSWVVGYNNSVEQAQNQLTLLNIMRASEEMPLLFTGVQVVRGNGQNTVGASLGISATDQSTTVTTGPNSDTTVGVLAPSVTLQVSSGFNFDVVVLDSAEFYQGLLTPIGIDALHALSKKGVPAELLLYLAVERITLKVGGVATTYVNDPSDQHYERFRSTLGNLLKMGLTTELVSSSTPLGPLLTDADLKADLKSMFAAAQAGLLPIPESGGYRFVKNNVAARLCFMGEGSDVPTLPQDSLCATSPKRVSSKTKDASPSSVSGTLVLPDAEMSVQTRSTRDIFSYLGRLANRQTDAGRDGVTLEMPVSAAFQNLSKGKSLFRVVKGSPKSDDIAAIEYRGSVYSVPSEGQGYSATVLAVLRQFFSLSKSVNSVPLTGTVVVR
jgi:hypothetical protein